MQRLARVAVLVEVFGEAAFGARKTDKVIDLVRLRFDEEIQFLGGTTNRTSEALINALKQGRFYLWLAPLQSANW